MRTADIGQTLSFQAFRRLREYITGNDLGPGDRLPPEGELADMLGVSRNTARDALKSLEVVGALSRRPKIGCVLQPVDLRNLSEITQFMMMRTTSDLEDLLVVRRIIEVNALDLVIENATEESYQQMEEAIKMMEAEVEMGGLGHDADLAFHQAVLEATGNSFISQLGGLIQEFFRDPSTRVAPEPGRERADVEAHSEMLRHLRDGNLAQAKQTMEEHLGHWNRFFKGGKR